jgi:hypothetical protein
LLVWCVDRRRESVYLLSSRWLSLLPVWYVD